VKLGTVALRRSIAAFFSCFAVGCSSFWVRPAPAPNPVEIRKLTAEFTSDSQGEFRVGFSVRNPGTGPGSVRGITWELWLYNQWFAAGTSALQQALPAAPTQEFEVVLPVVLPRSPTLPGVTQVRVGLRGTLEGKWDGSGKTLAFERSLIVPVKNAPSPNQDDEL
jgi:hypothetical protein